MPTKNKNVIGESSAKEQQLRNQWVDFSKTDAYKELMDYMTSQGNMLLQYAEELQMPNPNPNIGGKVAISGEIANLLLQNRRGINIVKTYISIYSN